MNGRLTTANITNTLNAFDEKSKPMLVQRLENQAELMLETVRGVSSRPASSEVNATQGASSPRVYPIPKHLKQVLNCALLKCLTRKIVIRQNRQNTELMINNDKYIQEHIMAAIKELNLGHAEAVSYLIHLILRQGQQAIDKPIQIVLSDAAYLLIMLINNEAAERAMHQGCLDAYHNFMTIRELPVDIHFEVKYAYICSAYLLGGNLNPSIIDKVNNLLGELIYSGNLYPVGSVYHRIGLQAELIQLLYNDTQLALESRHLNFVINYVFKCIGVLDKLALYQDKENVIAPSLAFLLPLNITPKEYVYHLCMNCIYNNINQRLFLEKEAQHNPQLKQALERFIPEIINNNTTQPTCFPS